MKKPYNRYSKEQLDKIGNTIIYLIKNIPNLPKTKLLKLLYIIDEESIKKGGLPLLNLNYEVWKLGPVDRDVYIDLNETPALLAPYISKKRTDTKVVFEAKTNFCDDEFSDNEIELLEKIVAKFGCWTARMLVDYTHREGSLWHTIAKENNMLEELEQEKTNSTELDMDLSRIIEDDERKKQIYQRYQKYN